MDELFTVRDLPISEARNYLGAFLFTGDDVFRPVSTLSGGERGRLALAKLALDGANFLLLDEPTNHLDVTSQEILQTVLAQFNGTILLVSHDRYLIDALATQIWDLQPGRMTVFEGPYQEFLQAREAERQAARDGQTESPRETAASAPGSRQNGKSQLSEYQRRRRLEAVEAQIHRLEEQLDRLSRELEEASAAGSVERVRALGESYTAAEEALQAALNDWEALVD
jgi:ATP-binding cassette subfamily F protein 3